MEKPDYALALIDAQNLWYTPKGKWGARVDYKKLLARISKKNRHVDPIIYLVADSVTDQSKFIEHLHGIGYTTRMKMMYRLGGRARNTNWDEEMIEEAREMMNAYSTLILVSGDHGFGELLEEARAAGKRTEIFCFESDFAQRLTDSADAVTFLDREILMAPRRRARLFLDPRLSGFGAGRPGSCGF